MIRTPKKFFENGCSLTEMTNHDKFSYIYKLQTLLNKLPPTPLFIHYKKPLKDCQEHTVDLNNKTQRVGKLLYSFLFMPC